MDGVTKNESDRVTRLPKLEPSAEFVNRLHWALRDAGLSPGQFARKLREPSRRVDEMLGGSFMPELRAIVTMAAILGVDPRWLSIGILAPAAAAARTALCKAAFRTLVSEVDLMALRQILGRSTIEPDRGAGVCRYCGCTDDCGCGDCEWVDEACTICSACLLPGEEDDR